MRCSECGYMNEEAAAVCIKCGTKLKATNPSVEDKQKAPPITPKSEGAKTMRGKPADDAAWDQPMGNAHKADSAIRCPSCGFYPLRSMPVAGNGCPNCGYEGGSMAEAEEGTARTVKLGEMKIGENSPMIRLKDESSGKIIELSGREIPLNRQILEPGNASISGSSHAILSWEDGKLLIEDKSSNGATFVQVKGRMEIAKGDRIVLGNKIYTLEID